MRGRGIGWPAVEGRGIGRLAVMRRGIRWPAVRRRAGEGLAVGLLLLLPLACGEERPAGGGVTAGRPAVEVPDFDGERAHAMIAEQVAFGPRVPGSSGHARQLAWMQEYLRERADSLELQPFSHAARAGDTIRMTNLIARFRPDAPDRILLLSHWDTRPTADEESDPARRARPIPGANDGGSGTAVLLQLADVLSRHSPPIGVDLLFVDGEDYGPGEMFLGSTYFAANLPPGYRPLYGILVDMVGDRDPVFPVEGNSYRFAPEVVERVWRLAGELGYGRTFPRRDGPVIDDDHLPLNRAGIRTIDIIDFDYRHWHTLDDTPDRTAPTGLKAVGTLLTALVYRGG